MTVIVNGKFTVNPTVRVEGNSHRESGNNEGSLAESDSDSCSVTGTVK